MDLFAGLTTAQTVISILGNVASFCLLIAPAFTFHRVKRTGTIGNVDVFPFLFTFFNALMWVADSIPDVRHSTPILIINAVGSFLEFIWIVLFIYHSTGTKRTVAIVSLVASLLGSAIVFTLVFTQVKPKKWSPTFLGYLAAGSGCAMYLFPLWSTAKMCKANDGGDMNLLMVLSSMINGGIWCAFAKVGRRRINWFIMVPNITAVICATGQFIAWIYLFKNKPPVLPVLAGNQGGALRQGDESRVLENLRAEHVASQAVVSDIEMAVRSSSLAKSGSRRTPSKSVSGASGSQSKSVPGTPTGYRSPSKVVFRSPTSSVSDAQSRSGSRSPSRQGTPSGSRSPTRPSTPSKPVSDAPSRSGSRSPTRPGTPSGSDAPSRPGSRSPAPTSSPPTSSAADKHDEPTE